MIPTFKIELIDPETWKLVEIDENVVIYLDYEGILKAYYDNKELVIRKVDGK